MARAVDEWSIPVSVASMASSGSAETRAVIRLIEPGNDAACATCGKAVKFSARSRTRQVIANVYEGGSWQRVEHFHEHCYRSAGEPFGRAAEPSSERPAPSAPT